MNNYKIIVIGCSMGGITALEKLLSPLPSSFSIPIVIVQHISPVSENYLVDILNDSCNLIVKEVDEKEKIKKGHIYIAPPDYHVLIETDFTFTLSLEDKVNFSRPSIDVLFETAADCCKNKTIGIILTGANNDGASGLKKIKNAGGITIVQEPIEAKISTMPKAAIKSTGPHYILKLEKITGLLIKFT
jgi:two-component system chemotaxis response regulator CheB